MKRTLVAIAVLGSLVAGTLMPHGAEAKLAKPKKIDPKLTLVTGGSPWPLGLDGQYGYMRLTFPSPALTELISKFTVTCTPSPGTGADLTQYPDDVLTQEFNTTISGAPAKYTSTDPNFANAGGNISLTVGPYVDAQNTGAPQYPSLKCSVMAHNLAAPAGVAGKAQKIGTAPAADCGDPDASVNPLYSGRTRNTPTTAPGLTTLYMPVTIDATVAIGAQFPFCTTGNDSRARFNSDQLTKFSYSAKVANKKGARTGEVKKLKLTAELTHEIPFLVKGAVVKYAFDKTKLQITSCVASAAKVAGKTNTCTYNNTTGTITLTSNDQLTVKKDKPIVSPTITFTFTQIGAIGSTTAITYVESATTLQIGPADVDVKLMDDDRQRTLLALPACNPSTETCPDPNFDYPIVALTLV